MRYETKMKVVKWSALACVWLVIGSFIGAVLTQNFYFFLPTPVGFGIFITSLIIND